MSRVHCLECGGQVVLDPRGVCPEGHHVGASGARIEQAMGHEVAHPDEPEPWVYTIDPSELSAAGARANGANGPGSWGLGQNGTGPREARPVHVPSFGDEASESSGAESLLRELHSLAAFDQQHAGGNTPSTPVNGAATREQRSLEDTEPVGPPPPPTGSKPQVARAPRPDPDAIAEAFAELSALDAPAQAMTSRSSANGRAHLNERTTPGRTQPGTADRQDRFDHDELASLFNTPPPPASAPAPDDSASTGAHVPDDAGPQDALRDDDPGRDALSHDDPGHDDPAASGPDASATADLQPPSPGSGPGTGAQDQHGPGAVPEPPVELPPAPPAHHRGAATTDRFEVDATELAFELNFDDGEPVSAAQPDITELLDGLSTGDGLFGDVDAGDAAPTAGPAARPSPTPDPTPPRDTTADPTAAPSEASTPSVADAGSDQTGGPTRAPTPDLTSFTAKGGSAGRGGRRRRFGR